MRHVRLLSLGLGIAAAATLATTAHAQTYAPIYGIRHTVPPEIWTIDLDTGAATFVSKNLKKSKCACARHPRTGLIWTFSNITPNKISVWDPVTDVETTIHSGPNVQFHRVGFDADCKLYGVPLNSNTLYTIDTTTGALTKLGGMKTVDSAGSGGDLAFAPGEVDKITYFAGKQYYEVNVHTLQGTKILDNVGFTTTGAGYTADGRLWVTNDTDLYECDPADGTMQHVGSFGMSQILDITEDLSPMYFGTDNNDPLPDEDVTIFTRQGAAGGLMLLAAIAVDGVPTFVDLGLFSFDAAGEWSLTDTVPPGLSGGSIDLQCYGFAVSGDLLFTNTQLITFR